MQKKNQANNRLFPLPAEYKLSKLFIRSFTTCCVNPVSHTRILGEKRESNSKYDSKQTGATKHRRIISSAGRQPTKMVQCSIFTVYRARRFVSRVHKPNLRLCPPPASNSIIGKRTKKICFS